jgi:ABC-type phosphate/phosphonate transport system permease subunit
MMIRIFVAGIVGTIVSMAAGFVVWGMLLSGYMQSTLSPSAKAVMSEQPRMLPFIAAQLGFGFFFAFVLERWAGARSAVSGLFAGAVLGFFYALISNLMNDAFFVSLHIGSNIPPMLVDIAAGTVVGGIIGAAEGVVLGFMARNRAAAEVDA